MKEDLLIYKSLSHQITEDERIALKSWISLAVKNEAKFLQWRETWEISGNYLSDMRLDIENPLQKYKEHLEHELQKLKSEQSISETTQWISWKTLLILVLIVGILMVVYFIKN
ncbi:MAG: hypothetical protein M3Q56_07065 [Bacteroidota bacterium]|nr:hypothetical protein [Bacteroidota bacterium]